MENVTIFIEKKVADGLGGIGIAAYSGDELIISGQMHVRPPYLDMIDLAALKFASKTLVANGMVFNDVIIVSQSISEQYVKSVWDSVVDYFCLFNNWTAKPQKNWSTTKQSPVVTVKKYADEALLREGELWAKAVECESGFDILPPMSFVDYHETYSPSKLGKWNKYELKKQDGKIFIMGATEQDGRWMKRQVSFPDNGLAVQQVVVYHPGYETANKSFFVGQKWVRND